MPKNQLVIKVVFSVFLAIGFLMPWSPSDVLAAVSCYGEGTSTLPSCTGKFAGYQGCTSTNASDPNYWIYNGAKIERRQSNDCNAKWTRITNVSGSARYTAGSTNYGCSAYCYNQSVQSGGAIANGALVYTPMKGLTGTPVLSCGATSTSIMSLPIYSPPPSYTGCKAW
jgi:hypothetical protein